MATEKQVPGRRKPRLSQKDFESLVNKNFPSWNAVWNLLLEGNRKQRRGSRQEGPPGAMSPDGNSPGDLREMIRRKITELVNEEQVLAGLYQQAADAAREREEELREKSAVLMHQIEKDKHLMRTLANLS